MDDKQIVYFLEVARAGSFTAAAGKLYISVPGLVKIMDKLEAELEATLFLRTRTGVQLTQAGMTLARLAPQCLRHHELIREEVRKAETLRETRVKVCMTWGLLSFFPRDFLSRFVLQNPDVSLSTRNDSLSGCRQALSSGRDAIGLTFGELEDPALRVLFNRTSALVALMSSAHPLAQKEALSLADLASCRLVVLSSDPGVNHNLLRQLSKAGAAPQITLDGAEWPQALELIRNAGYVSFCLPPRALRDERLAARPVHDLELTLNFNMAAPKGVALSVAERRFADYVLELMHGGRQ